MIGAETLGVDLFPAWVEYAAWILAAAAGAGYIAHARRAEKPVLDLRLLKVATYRANQTGGSLIRMTLGAMPFLLPLLLQSGLGWTPLQAGGLTMASAFGSLGARVGAQTVLRKFGFKATLMVTAVACGVAVGATGWFRASTPVAVMAAVLALGGFLRSNNLTSSSTLAFADLADRQVSQASSFTSVVQQMSQALGITLAGLTLRAAQLVNGPGVRPLDPQNFILPFAAVGLCGMLAALTYLPLPRTAGSNLHGREGVRGRR
jgi:hypothetical protein